MRRICCYLLAALMALMVLLPFAPALAVSKSVRVGLLTEGGVDTVPADERHTALLMDALDELQKYTNWSYTFISGTEEELLMMLSAGVIDLLGGVYYRPELAETILYPTYATGYSHALLVAGMGDESIQQYDYQSMQGKRIAVVEGARETNQLRAFMVINSMSNTLVGRPTQEAALQSLERGEVDMALLSGDGAQGFRVITQMVVEPYYFAVCARRADLYEDLMSALELILDTDVDYVDKLYAEHFVQAQVNGMTITPRERAYIDKGKPLVIAVPDGNAPLQSFDENGEPVGIGVDVLRLVASRAGLEVILVRADSIPDAVAMVERDDAHGVLGLSLLDGSVRSYDLVMTRGYLDMLRVAVISKYVEYPSQQMTLALMPGMEYLIDDFTGEIVYADTFAACVGLVNQGTADYTYGSSYFVEYGTQSRAYQNVQMLTLPGASDSMGIGLHRPVDPSLLTLMNKGIASVTEEELQDIVLNNTALREESQSLMSLIYAYPTVVVLVLVIFIGIIVAVAVIINIQRTRHSRALYRTQYTDELTGALNLAGFRREGARLLAGEQPYAVSYSSVKAFKYINDRYGFEEGDGIIRRVADTYRQDMEEGEIFCRANGATFIALRRYDTQEALLARINRFHERVWEITPHNDQCYHLRLSTGLYIGAEGERLGILGRIDRANAARQQIKDSTEQHYAFYTEGSYDTMLHAQEIEGRMEAALANHDFVVYLQPKYRLDTMKPAAAEALVRWIDDGRLIPPGEFIPQFERNGFIARLDRFMFESCCALLRRWIDSGMPVVPISINVSRVQLYAPDFVDSYVAIKEAHAIPDGLLELEFTESILFEDVDRLIELVEHLHEHGFACSIDDFGKGYSSLTMIKNIPADTLKLDAAFFDESDDAQRGTIIIESVVEMARALGMTTVAEGIEQREQVEQLRRVGCDMVQGYVFSRPLDVEAFELYLRQKLVEGRDPYAPLEREEGV